MSITDKFEEDANLVVRIQLGDRDAFDLLVNKYDRRLLYFVRRMVDSEDEALDILQSAWLRAFRSIHKLREPKAFQVWLYRIAHDEYVTSFRKKSRQIPVEHESEVGPTDDSSTSMETCVLNVEIVHTILKRLSWEHRQVLTLMFMEGMSVTEIAEVINVKLGTVKSRLHYARQAFRTHFEEITND